MPVRTIDVSRWQGSINWPRVAGSGVAGAWIKVGGADGSFYKDGRADENMAGAAAAGMPYGTYYFASPSVGGGRRQAQHALSIGHASGPLGPALDLETHNGLSGPQLDQFARDFCDTVMEATGRETIVYTGAWIGVPGSGSYFGYTDESLSHCALWIASYGNNAPGFSPPSMTPAVPGVWSDTGWSMWQFNSMTRVPGIEENTVDQNVAKDAFWEAQLSGADAPMSQGWQMKSVGRFDQDAEYYIGTDGFGFERKIPIRSQGHKRLLVGAGTIDGPVDQRGYNVSDPEELTEFDRIPIANEKFTADMGGLKLAAETVRQVNEFTAESASSSGGGTEVVVASAKEIVDEITRRLED